jgi:colanic acid biosynthesis glycosyl transferase WcaI
MKIIVHDYGGYPFIVQLSRSLAQRGHTVLHLYAGSNTTPRGSLNKTANDSDTFDSRAITIQKPIQKESLVHRWMQENEYAKILALEIENYRPDVVISADTPLDAQAKALKSTHKIGAHFVFWLQDIIGLATFLTLKKKNKLLGLVIGNYYIWLEKYLLKKSDYIVTIADDFLLQLNLWGIGRERSLVIPNWAPLSELPLRPKVNSWSIQNGVDEKTLLLYTGSLGMKHDPNMLLQLAIAFKDDDHIRVMVVSEGIGAAWLHQKKNDLDLSNLLLLGYQSMNDLPNLLASGDVLISILEPDASLFSIPSKVLSYLCAHRPLLLSMPVQNLASRIVLENQAGTVVSSGDTQAFVEAARLIITNIKDQELYGANGRRYAEANFNIDKVTQQFEQVLIQAIINKTPTMHPIQKREISISEITEA